MWIMPTVPSEKSSRSSRYGSHVPSVTPGDALGISSGKGNDWWGFLKVGGEN